MFQKKTWEDRITEYPARRTLTQTDGTAQIVTVARSEGSITQEGDAFSAENMNDLEGRIEEGFTAVNNDLGNCTFSVQGDGAYVTYVPAGGADAVTKKLGSNDIVSRLSKLNGTYSDCFVETETLSGDFVVNIISAAGTGTAGTICKIYGSNTEPTYLAGNEWENSTVIFASSQFPQSVQDMPLTVLADNYKQYKYLCIRFYNEINSPPGYYVTGNIYFTITTYPYLAY